MVGGSGTTAAWAESRAPGRACASSIASSAWSAIRRPYAVMASKPSPSTPAGATSPSGPCSTIAVAPA